MLGSSLFLLLTGYYLLKTVRETLILTEGGAEIKSYASAGQALILLFALPAFGWIANKISGFHLVRSVYLFFAANLAIFFMAGRAGAHVAVPFYLWLGVFSVVSIALFWSYSNDIYSDEQGRRLFPYIGIGASLGGFFGAMMAKRLAALIQPHTAMLLGAALLVVSIILLARVRHYIDPQPVRDDVAAPERSRGGFRLVASERYLLLIAVMVVLTNVVNSTGEFMMGKEVVAAAKAHGAGLQKQFITSFYADYFMIVSLVGACIQALGVAPIFKRFGAGGALLILPMIAIGGYAAIAVLPMMWIIRAAKVAENSLDYSLQNTAKHALFLPTSQEIKYKAKATIDSFFIRFGDLAQAGLVMAGSALSFTTADYAKLNTVVALLWLGTAALAAQEYRRRTAPVVQPVRVPRPRPAFPAVSAESAC